MRAFLGAAFEAWLKALFICGSSSAADNGGMNIRPAFARGGCIQAVWLALALAALAWQPVQADEKPDHERARAAVQAGEVMPLPALLERLQRSHPGQVLELELERDDGQWVYEVKLLQPQGQLLRLKLDARTGEVLSAKRRDAKPPRARPAP